MRILSILALISLPFAAASQKRLGEKREEVSSHAVHHQVEVSSGCTDNKSFRDLLKNGCGWYAERKNLRCPYAGPFSKNGLSAADECCACGGGVPDNDPTPKPGKYYIKSPSFSKYINFSGQNGVSLGFQNDLALVNLRDEGSGTFSLMGATLRDIRYVNIANSGTVSSSRNLSANSKFQLIPADGGRYKMKNVRNGRFLSAFFNGVLESTFSQNTPYVEFEFIPSNAENFELKNEMTDVKMKKV
jgi:hypothetical protein